jgi:uncharacterized membrane protein (DUF485 family)
MGKKRSKERGKRKPQIQNKPKMTFWDVLWNFVEKKQLKWIVIIILAIRIPPKNILAFAELLLDKMFGEDSSKLQVGNFLGYVFCVLTIVISIIFIWLMRRFYDKEIARLAEERNFWQEKALADELHSSDET